MSTIRFSITLSSTARRLNGTATLDGTLNVRLINGFLPAVGNSFKIMTFSLRSPADSDFATYIGLNLPNGLDRQFSVGCS